MIEFSISAIIYLRKKIIVKVFSFKIAQMRVFTISDAL